MRVRYPACPPSLPRDLLPPSTPLLNPTFLPSWLLVATGKSWPSSARRTGAHAAAPSSDARSLLPPGRNQPPNTPSSSWRRTQGLMLRQVTPPLYPSAAWSVNAPSTPLTGATVTPRSASVFGVQATATTATAAPVFGSSLTGR